MVDVVQISFRALTIRKKTMSNPCLNHLYVVGGPEHVEEFRIVNAQNMLPNRKGEELLKAIGLDGKQNLFASAHLVGYRQRMDLSFHGLAHTANDMQSNVQTWGTSIDISGNSWRPETKLDSSPWSLPNGEKMSREYAICFDAAYSPPSNWLNIAAHRFQDLSLCLTFADAQREKSGYLLKRHGKSDTILFDLMGTKKNPAVSGRVAVRSLMPVKRTENKLIKAIFENRPSHSEYAAVSVQNESTSLPWPRIFYAAISGATNAFEAILSSDVQALWQSKSNVGLVDILMDIYPDQAPELVHARTRMLGMLFDRHPELAVRPLGSGVTPAEMAVRFRMAGVIALLFKHHAMDATGEKGGWKNEVTENASLEMMEYLSAVIPKDKRADFFAGLAIGSANQNDIALMLGAVGACDGLNKSTRAILGGKAKFKKHYKVSDEFADYFNAAMAKKTMSDILCKLNIQNRNM